MNINNQNMPFLSSRVCLLIGMSSILGNVCNGGHTYSETSRLFKDVKEPAEQLTKICAALS